MRYVFKYRGKKFVIPVNECKTNVEKARGLMFRSSTKALLFYFKKPTREPIHSFFCRKFVAVWTFSEEVIEIKKVSPWKLSIRPKHKFDKLLEIPEGNPLYLRFAEGDKERFKYSGDLELLSY